MAKNSKGIETAQIISDKCIACQICIGECPVGAIELGADGVAHVDPEICVGCGKCSEVCPVGAVLFEKKRRKKPAGKGEAIPGKAPAAVCAGVAVFVEIASGAGAQVSWELAGKARLLAEKLDTKVMGFLVGSGVDDIAAEAVSYGCDEVHVIDHPDLGSYFPVTYGKALSDLCETLRPEILLIGASHLGRDLAGVVATRLGTGLTADCTGLNIDPDTKMLLMTRPTFGGNIMATIFCERHRPQMSSVRPRVMPLPRKDPARSGAVVQHEWIPPVVELPVIVDFIRDVPEMGSVDIVRAPALVVAGRGACDADSVAMLQELADLLGGVVACSRPVVESGRLPYERQVGQTGKTVAPKLYIGIGVSGAVQHLTAIQGSEKIIAINPDPNAPIFTVADIGIVGNAREVVPELIAQLKIRLGRET